MIPVRLKIKGLYSYREEVNIDFERLSAQHLFGIFGPVGSGKSAILEAITFALYGKTERLNISGDNRNYNMMNLQSQELLIELEFKTIVSGNEERYLFRVKQTRNSKKFEEVKAPTRTALHWKAEDWEALESTDASEILRLSYENFIKTIIIPQGKFQDFLHMGATDRTRMLREIFDLGRYELDRPTKALLAETRTELVRVEEKLLPLATADAETIAAQEAAHETAKAALQAANSQVHILQQAAAQWERLRTLGENIALKRAALLQQEAHRATYAARAQRLTQYQQARLQFGEVLAEKDRLARECTRADAQVTQVRTQLQALLPAQAAAVEAAQAAKLAWEGKAELEAKAQDCARWIDIRAGEEKIKQLQVRITNGSQVLAKQQTELQVAQQQLAENEGLLQAKRKAMPDLAVIGEVLLWHSKQAQYRQRSTELTTQISEAAAAIGGWKSQQLSLATAHGIALAHDQSLSTAITERMHTVKSQASAVREQREQLSRHGGLATYSVELQDGAPCPLCGSVHHPSPYDTGTATTQLAAFAAEIMALEQQQAQLESSLQAAQNLAIRMESMDKQMAQAQQAMDRLQVEQKEHLLAFAWPQYDPQDATAAEASRKQAVDLQADIQQLEQDRTKLQEGIQKLQEDFKKYESALQQLREENSHLQGHRDSLRQQVTLLTGAPWEQMEATAITLEMNAFTAAATRLQSALEATQKEAQSLAIQVAEANQKLTSATDAQTRLQQEMQAISEQFAHALAASNFEDESKLREVLQWQLDIAKEQAAIDEFQAALLRLETELKMLEAQADSQEYDPEAHRTAADALREIQQEAENLQEQVTLLQQHIAQLKEALVQRAELQARQGKLRQREENLKILERMFMASGFVKYVSTIYLQELVARADVRFRKLTRNALSLELGADSEFLVRDMLNGGQTRSVKTLSGGQTFQASLCLALALAENVQQHSGSSHNFFFLDEGFGTLDRESLGAVFDALKQLRQENRIVGVISHVEDLQQEIELYLSVAQTEARGSFVRGSWE